MSAKPGKMKIHSFMHSGNKFSFSFENFQGTREYWHRNKYLTMQLDLNTIKNNCNYTYNS